MDFITGLPRTRRQHDSIWVIVDKVTKSAHFLAVKTTDSVKDYAKLYINEIFRLDGVALSIISDRERTIQTLEDMLRAYMMEFKSIERNTWEAEAAVKAKYPHLFPSDSIPTCACLLKYVERARRLAESIGEVFCNSFILVLTNPLPLHLLDLCCLTDMTRPKIEKDLNVAPRDRLNLRLIIEEEIVMRAKQRQTSLPFSVLIREFFERARILFVAKTDVEVMPTSSIDIWRIEVVYTRDEAERNKITSVDTYPTVDIDMLQADTTSSTQADEHSGTPSSSVSTTSGPTAFAAGASHLFLTQCMLYRMGHLAYSADVHAFRVEREVPAIFEIPSATTIGDNVLADDGDEADTPEMDEKELGTCEAAFNEDKRARQGHYRERGNEKAEKVIETQGLMIAKSTNRRVALQLAEGSRVSAWERPTWQWEGQMDISLTRSAMEI
ncbi:hypothetical protein MTR67_017867 [Solanum verrucosum]|uniref:Uncharacterized protein n=1 Tax=Solanum verrucosum TaxID=315347 RepID=A0AAF0QKN6_SOLVR|nr:hypothetical protein MTR67_017867 [Solanum verrucosum]